MKKKQPKIGKYEYAVHIRRIVFSIVHNFIIISGCAVGAAFLLYNAFVGRYVMGTLSMRNVTAVQRNGSHKWTDARKAIPFFNASNSESNSNNRWYRRKSHIHANLGGNLYVVVNPCKYGLIDRGWTIECMYIQYTTLQFIIRSNVKYICDSSVLNFQ